MLFMHQRQCQAQGIWHRMPFSMPGWDQILGLRSSCPTVCRGVLPPSRYTISVRTHQSIKRFEKSKMRESWLCDWLTWKCMRMDVACDILFPYYDTLNWIQSKQQLHFLSEFLIQSILSCMAPFASAKSWKSPSPALLHIGSAVTSVQGFEAPPAVVLEAVGCQRFDGTEIWNTSHAACCITWQWNDIFLQNPIQYHYIPLSRILRNIGLPFHFPKWNTAAYIAVLWIRPKVPPTPRQHSGAFVPQCHALLAHLGVLKISWSVLPTWWITVLVVYLLAGWLHDNSPCAGDLEQRGQCHHEQRHHSPNLGANTRFDHSTGHNLSIVH